MPKTKVRAKIISRLKFDWIFVFCWAVGIFLIYNGIKDIHRSAIAGILGVISGLLLTPYTWQKITDLAGWHPIKEVRIVLIILTFWFSVLF